MYKALEPTPIRFNGHVNNNHLKKDSYKVHIKDVRPISFIIILQTSLYLLSSRLHVKMMVNKKHASKSQRFQFGFTLPIVCSAESKGPATKHKPLRLLQLKNVDQPPCITTPKRHCTLFSNVTIIISSMCCDVATTKKFMAA